MSNAPLGDLTNLYSLLLSGNLITDPTPLLKLTDLRGLYLDNNPLTNPANLSAFTNLAFLSIGGSAITNLDWLAGLPQMYALSVFDSDIADLSPLAGLTNLAYLDLVHTRTPDFARLGDCTNLTRLTLSEQAIANLDFLSGLWRIGELNLFSTPASDLTPITRLTNLYSFTAYAGHVTNITVLEKLPRLSFVSVYENWLELSPDSEAMRVITDLQERGCAVNYLPQNQPPQVMVRTNWLMATGHPAWLPVFAYDQSSYNEPLSFSYSISNPELIAEASMVLDPNGSSRLNVRPAPNRSGETDLTLMLTDEAGLRTNVSIHLTVAVPSHLDGTILDSPDLVWQTAGDPPWFGQSNVSHDGIASAQSGAADSWLETTVTGPGTLQFWHKSSTNYEGSGGLLTAVAVDSGLSGSLQLNGSIGWHQETVGLPAGTWVLRWDTYLDPYADIGTNTLWLDEVNFKPGPPAFWLGLESNPSSGQIWLVPHGEPGATYELEVSSDLQHWVPENRATLADFTAWISPVSWQAPGQFYRLRKVAPPL